MCDYNVMYTWAIDVNLHLYDLKSFIFLLLQAWGWQQCPFISSTVSFFRTTRCRTTCTYMHMYLHVHTWFLVYVYFGGKPSLALTWVLISYTLVPCKHSGEHWVHVQDCHRVAWTSLEHRILGMGFGNEKPWSLFCNKIHVKWSLSTWWSLQSSRVDTILSFVPCRNVSWEASILSCHIWPPRQYQHPPLCRACPIRYTACH